MSRITQQKIDDKVLEIKKLLTTQDDKKLIDRAYMLALKSHGEQKRASSDPYIIHPVEAALTLAKLQLDAVSIASALLHDVVDDTPVTLGEIEKEFGEEIAFLVDGVSKLGRLKYRGTQRHTENLRKMLVAMAQDIRVILIKFADRLHNMETLDALPERKRHRIALETLEIYAPIAMRLGVFELAKKMEDLAFPYIYPDQYKYIKAETMYRSPEAEKYLKKLHPVVSRELKKENIRPLEIQMRAKHYYSLWKKLEKNNYNWSQIHDLVAMRIVVDSVEECYGTLGALHKLWKPMPGQIKDYIALPKPNGYQSLHTTVFCVDGKQTEFQIRTREMHSNAEHGVAAHWQYKSLTTKNDPDTSLRKKYQWVRDLHDLNQDTSKSEEFLGNLKIDVFQNHIFVFTPKGDVIDLPQGSVPIDFAYAIHSNVGDSCSGAIINGKMAALSSELESGDMIEVLTSKNKTPSRAWLGYVKTSNARNNIKRWFRQQNREENTTIGLNIINIELKAVEGKSWNQLSGEEQKNVLEKFSCETDEDLFSAVGQGDISATKVMQGLITEKEAPAIKSIRSNKKIRMQGNYIRVAGIDNMKTNVARCCNPLPPESILAYVTIDRGATVHKINCRNLYKHTARTLPAYWSKMQSGQCVRLEMKVTDRVGMVQDISQMIANLNINIISFNTNDRDGDPQNNTSSDEFVTIVASVEINNLDQLKRATERLRSIDGVLEINRI